MTDTGQVPGEGLPENAGTAEQPGAPAPDAYAYLSESTAEDDDLLLLPGAQGAWGNEVAPPVPEPVVETLQRPDAHEVSGRDSGSVDLGGVRPPAPDPAQVAPPRRPLHLGPPIPDASASPVRSLADRGPADAPMRQAPTPAPAPAPVPAPGPEYLDVPQTAAMPPQGAAPWGAQATAQEQVPTQEPVQVRDHEHAREREQEQEQAREQGRIGGGAAAAETVVPTPDTTAESAGAAQAVVARVATEAVAATGGTPRDGGAALATDGSENAEGAGSGADAVDAAGDPAGSAGPVAPVDAVESGISADSATSEDARPAGEGAGAPLPADDAGPETAEAVAEPVAPDVPAAPEPAEAQESAEAPEAPEDAEGPAMPEAVAPEAPAPPAVVTEAFEPEPVGAPAATPEPVRATEDGAEEAPAPLPGPAPEAVPAPDPAVAEEAAAGQPEAQPAQGPQSVVDPVPADPLQPDGTLGRFVPVEGQVPTTPHLAPTPPQPITLPPAAEPAAQDPVPEDPATVVPGPREAVPEPDPEPVQRADDLDTRAAAGQEHPHEQQNPQQERRDHERDHQQELPEGRQGRPDHEGRQGPGGREAESGPHEQQAPQVQDASDVRELSDPGDPGDAGDPRAPGDPGPAAPAYDEAEREAVLKVMRERRDIRNGFRSDPIPHEVLLRVLEAAHTAPSVGHSQPWDFVVIRSADTRRAMHELAMRQREAYAKSLPKGRAKQFKELKIEAILDTPVNIVVTADPTRGGRHTLGRHTQPQMAPYSSALAVENLWLAARAEGLGVGWVSFFDEREMVRALDLPEHLEVVAYLCVGYVDEFPDEPELMQAGWSKRRPLSWVVHEETYGRRALPGEDPHDLLAETVAQIRPLDAKALGEAWERQKRMTKPAGALGMLEIISAQLSGLSRQCPPPVPEPAAVAIFAGDHGVHAQGVTPWPQEVTGQMVANFLGGGAVCNAFAGQVGAEVCVVDVGVATDLPATPGLLPRKIRAGTSDMTTGPAMTREEAKQAIEVGIETARDLVAAGNKALLTGEMGIANTTASAALISVFTGADPAEVTGRGTGINDETLARKTEVVRRAIELHQPDPADPIGVLAALGGFEHAAMVGLLLGGSSLRTPVILDGVSAGAAALVARAIAPEVLAACIAGHRSAEPGHVAALNKLGLRPLVDLDLRLGEGTGALLALPMVQSTARAMHEVATFDSAGVTEK
ncbi:nicotinate-nucleotide--dimethylbenzimidazole phosphoribosyltransferase [Streptomyces poriticola]|uniref:nicotinate-nucleotide--dimethylbenzimidazole phosphoribosyltransferase n=1 Tax=Streptomyces poriticola TaxID=3120506 RepID=UPI002FCE37E7